MSSRRKESLGPLQNLRSTPAVTETPESGKESLRDLWEPDEEAIWPVNPPSSPFLVASFPLWPPGPEQAGWGRDKFNLKSSWEVGLIPWA